MTPDFAQTPDRLKELLADRAAFSTSPADEAEARGMLRDAAAFADEADAFELAAAALDLAFAARTPLHREEIPAAMPASLRAKLVSQGMAQVAAQASAQIAAQPASRRAPEADVVRRIGPGSAKPASVGFVGAAGWMAAAACLALAAAGWFARPAAGPARIDPAASRSVLLTSAPDLQQWDWAALGELEGKPVRGDIVWSTSKQQGFMTFAGLPANNASKEQYQLWIFDPNQSDKTPIDGGVFDVPPSASTVVVPMDPKIRVSGAALFAITIEKPGGVVVSDRSRLVLIAKPS